MDLNEAERAGQKDLERVAMNIFLYNTSMAARLAQGHGIDRELVAQCLEDLAAAVRTGDCAESLYALDDGHTLEQLVC